jgi:hypothetical protein
MSEDPNGWDEPRRPEGTRGDLRRAAGGTAPWELLPRRRFREFFPSDRAASQDEAEDYAEARAEAEEHTMDEREEW